jgi:hypothetical protein
MTGAQLAGVALWFVLRYALRFVHARIRIGGFRLGCAGCGGFVFGDIPTPSGGMS